MLLDKFNQNVYNSSADAWKSIMGDNFHFGYFEKKDTELSIATNALIDKMIELYNFSFKTKILDVGCGIGNPAFYLNEKYNCSVTGISTSERGIELANAKSKENGSENKVQFKVADAMKNGFPDNSFDLTWVMESSHMMHDKEALCKECFRVLKDDGALLLCDIMLNPYYEVPHKLLKHISKFWQVKKAFGYGQVNTFGYYSNRLYEAGFEEIKIIDISEETIPTMKNWKDITMEISEKILADFPKKRSDAFINACETLEVMFNEKVLCYGIIMARANKLKFN